jgi:ubiquinone/menaquinone biosynthesis C-methylase UbiE
MQKNTIDQKKWERFWRKQLSWKQTFSQMLFFVFRFIASYMQYRLAYSFFRGGSVLEIGCGSARSSILLARKKKNSELIGLDFSYRSIAIAKETSEKYRVNGSFILADANYLPFKHESFDLVWSAGVLEHFREPYPVIKEMVRVTKKDGAVLALIPSHNNLLVKIRNLVKKITGYYFDFDKLWGGTRAYRIDINNVFVKVKLKNVRARAIPLVLLIETMVIGWKR